MAARLFRHTSPSGGHGHDTIEDRPRLQQAVREEVLELRRMGAFAVALFKRGQDKEVGHGTHRTIPAMSARKAVPPLVLLGAVLAFYGRALDRPFTSEDFLLIRYLGEHPPWRDVASQLTQPWLGISVVKFVRPVSTLLYGIEIAVFRGQPFGYNLVHVLVHALNAVLVWIIVRRLIREVLEAEDEVTPLGAALLFAIHPLHPNAVIFSASFATIFGALFFLGSIAAYQRFRDQGSLVAWGAALLLFLLALGSYEAAAVLPGVLVAYDHVIGRRRPGRAMAGYLPFFGLLGLYLLLRRWIFGVTIGGYEEYSQRLLSPQIRRTFEDLATSIHQLHFPVYDSAPAAWAILASCAVFVGAPLVFWLFRRGGYARLWLFAWAFTLAAMAPFAFRPSVPGNGRYWYLAAAGVAMAACLAIRGIFARRYLAPAVAVLLGGVWAFLLVGYVGSYITAGRTARAIQDELLRVGTGPETFLTRYPYFVENEAKVPIAQIYHYGVWDSVHPPFTEKSVSVYPLPPLAESDLLPVVLGSPGSVVYEWEAGKVRRFTPPSGLALPEFQVLGPADGAVVDPARDFAEVAIPPGPHARFRLILSTPINGATFDVTPQGSVLRADLPDEILQTSDRLYGKSLHYWWVEARDAEGRVSGFSRMRSFRVSD
jgi:hypothetical protein